VVDGRIEVRQYLCVTVSFNHDIIDGAPAARFTQSFRELVETGYGVETLAG
jgi:pyruvate/2-oxoglutarate dehydrogenase complex dihydrolipoamide acyltransferase (E2) component